MTTIEALAALASLPDPEHKKGGPAALGKIDLSKASDDSLKKIALAEVTGGLSDEKVTAVAIHAYRALVMRGDGENLRFIVNLLGEWRDTFLEEFLSEEFGWVMAQLGTDAIPAALLCLRDALINDSDRAILAEGMEGMAGNGEATEEIHKAFAAHLGELRPERRLNASMIATLINQDRDNHHEAILAAYEANVVDVSVNGDRETVEIDLGLRTTRESEDKDPFELEVELCLEYRRSEMGPFPKKGNALERASYFIDLYRHPTGVHGVSMLDGLYAAVACSPRMVRPAALVHLPWDFEKAAPENSVTWANRKEAELGTAAMMDLYNEINEAFLAEIYVPYLPIYQSRKKGVQDIHNPAPWLTGVLAGARYLDTTHGPQPYSTRLMELGIKRLAECLKGASFNKKSVVDHLLPVVEVLCEEKQEIAKGSFGPSGYPGGLMPSQFIAPVTRQEAKTGRNDPCPCGSGRKYKKCCAN